MEDGTVFLYSIQPYELRNTLGAAVAILDEYIFTKKDGAETYKLYRTSEESWYDVNDQNAHAESSLLLALKNAVTSIETISRFS